MRYRVVGSDGRVLSVEAVDWMMAMCHVINHLDIEVSGWMCDNRPNGEVHVADPVHGHAWVVCPADRPMPARPNAPAPAALPPSAPVPSPVVPPPSSRAAMAPTVPPVAPSMPPPSSVQTLILPREDHEPRWKERSTPPGSLKVARQLEGVEPRRVAAQAAPADLAERLFELSTDVSGALSANEACSRALDVALQLVPCEAGSVARGGINDDSLTFVAASGPAGDKIIGRKVRYGEGIVGVAFDLGITVMVSDASADPRHMSEIDKSTGFKTRGILCVPVRTETEFFGAIELLNPPSGFQPWHIEVVESVARTLSTTLAGIT